MSKPFNSQSKNHRCRKSALPQDFQKKTFSQVRDPNTGFTAGIQERGQSHYTLVACDPFHRLSCEIALEIDDDDEGEGEGEGEGEEELKLRFAICHFPNISDQELYEFIREDETLYGMILIQFQMKLLKQLLLFCSSHDVSTLFIFTDTTSEGHALGVYRSLVAYEDKTYTVTGTKIQMAIPTTLDTFDALMELTDHVNEDFHQMLWEDQDANFAIRDYLKSNPCLKFFG